MSTQQQITRYFNPAQTATGALIAYGGRQVARSIGRRVRAKLTDWRNVSRTPSRFARKMTGPRRAFPKQQPKQRLTQTSRSGGYNQWEEEKKTNSLSKYKMSNLTKALKVLNAQKEKFILRWNGVKSFKTNGFYWLSNINDTGLNARLCPLYTYDLTACLNYQQSTYIPAQPLSQMYMTAAGDIGFVARPHLIADGITQSLDVSLEQSAYGNTQNVTPHNYSYLKWASIKMNCWGCQNRPTKYTIQLVKVTDDDVTPHHSAGITDKRNSLFQNIIKAKTFNPISTTGASLHRNKIKVLKTETFVIQPISTTETDQDPHCKTINWFTKIDKFINYVEKANKLQTLGDALDQADFVENQGQQNSAYTNPKSRIFLMIASTNFEIDTANAQSITPSFDLSVRTCHETSS